MPDTSTGIAGPAGATGANLSQQQMTALGYNPVYTGGNMGGSMGEGSDPGVLTSWQSPVVNGTYNNYDLSGNLQDTRAEGQGQSVLGWLGNALVVPAAFAAMAATGGALAGEAGAGAGAGMSIAGDATGPGIWAGASGAGDAYLPGALGAGTSGTVAGDAFMPGALQGVPGGASGTWAGMPAASGMATPGAVGTAGSSVPSWLNSIAGPGTFLGGPQGAFTGAGGLAGALGGQSGWLGPIMSAGSGLYGLSLAEQQRKLAQQAIAGSSPWTSSGGTGMAGDALKSVISGDFTKDAGFTAAQLAAARTSAQQPGGYAASAAAQAALKYQNDRIAALSAPAGVGFNPAAGYGTALQGESAANALTSSSLGSIGFGASGAGQTMPPWLQQYLIQNGMGGPKNG